MEALTRRRARSLASTTLPVCVLVLGACNRHSSTGPSPLSGDTPTPNVAVTPNTPTESPSPGSPSPGSAPTAPPTTEPPPTEPPPTVPPPTVPPPVAPPPPPPVPALTSLSIDGTLTINVGQTTQLQATAHYSDGSSQTVTASAAWTSSAPAGNVAAGLVAGVSAGTTSITATYAGQSAQATVQVSAVAPTLTGLSITGSTSVAVAGATQLQAVAQYSDGSTQTVTLLAIWTSSAPLRATVAAGLVAGGLPGSSTITASYSGFSAQVTVTVS